MKLEWILLILDFVGILDPSDPEIALNAHSIFENIKQEFNEWWATTETMQSEARSIGLLIRVFDSLIAIA